jgi:hypothetical protein
MSKKARLIEVERMEQGKRFEVDGDLIQAIKTYRAVLTKNPVHIQAASRLLILLRKAKDTHTEVNLLKQLVHDQQVHLENIRQNWISSHQQLAEDSTPLAKILGLLGDKNLPIEQNETLEKWKARLLSLEKRLNAKAEKAKLKKTPKKAGAGHKPTKVTNPTTKPAKKTAKTKLKTASNTSVPKLKAAKSKPLIKKGKVRS